MSNKPERIGYSEDPDACSYEWQFAAVYRHNGRFYIITDCGCGCNGPMSTYTDNDAVVGPAATMGGLFDELNVDKHHPVYVKEAFIDALVNMNDETIAATKAVLGLK